MVRNREKSRARRKMCGRPAERCYKHLAGLRISKGQQQDLLVPGMAFIRKPQRRKPRGIVMGARNVNGRKKAKRRAHHKTPAQREAILQNLLHDTALRKQRPR